jgi:N-acetylmuramoyl-L-alanine amidase
MSDVPRWPVTVHASPNCGPRPPGVAIDCVVLHADAGHAEAGTLDWLSRAESKVSYHWLIGRDGAWYLIVAESLRAWHAGKSSFGGRSNVNNFSIGVSFANNQRGESFPAVQIESGVELLRAIMRRHPAVTVDRITTHAQIAPGRKFDPGPLFPIAAVKAQLRAHSPLPEG